MSKIALRFLRRAELAHSQFGVVDFLQSLSDKTHPAQRSLQATSPDVERRYAACSVRVLLHQFLLLVHFSQKFETNAHACITD